MRAAVYYGPNKVEIADVPEPTPGPGTVKVKAATVDVTAGTVKVNTAMATFSGVVKCEVLKATAVVSTSYTPGAGNIW